MSSDRRVRPSDEAAILKTLSVLVHKLQSEGGKTWHRHIDVYSGLHYIMTTEHAYIVGETYLVVYAVGEPWWSDGDRVLQELLVLRIAVGGESFKAVPAFLERKAREAGCILVVAGTALAPADAALASLYSRFGYRPEAITLNKEP